MPLFKCDECGCIDNTALIPNYWKNKYEGKDILCTECITGKWHGEFKKESAKGMLIDQEGHLWSPEIVTDGLLPNGYKIIGKS